MYRIWLFFFRIKTTRATNFTTSSHSVYHMEVDQFRPGFIIYTDYHALMTSDGTHTYLIAGSTSSYGYREGVGAEARFSWVKGFVQITDERIVAVDSSNHCLRKIARSSKTTWPFCGHCDFHGYFDGTPGKFYDPWAIVRDHKNTSQLLVADTNNEAVRTVDISSGAVSTFVKSRSILYIRGITQDKNGDVYVTTQNAISRIAYGDRVITLLAGSLGYKGGYNDGSLLNAQFYLLYDLIFIGHKTLLVPDLRNKQVRLLDLDEDRVTTLHICPGCLKEPSSLLLTNDSLYVGQYDKIQRYTCK